MNLSQLLYVLIAILPLTTHAANSCDSKEGVPKPKKGDSIYLRGCGGNAKDYFSTPFQSGSISEVPSKVVSEKKSPNDRPFQTKAVSTIKINQTTLTATLDDFRNLKITSSSNQTLSERKVTGSTSLYELSSNQNTLAWAVGWHKNSREYYQNADFTTFRVYLPTIQNDKMTILERNFLGILQSQFQSLLKKDTPLILIEGKQLGVGAYGCYYCRPEFFILDPIQGFVSIHDKETSEKYLDLDKTENPLMVLFWIVNKQDIRKAREYIKVHFDKIVINGNERKIPLSSSSKEKCFQSLKQENPFSKEEVYRIFQSCFPPFVETNYYRDWLDDAIAP